MITKEDTGQLKTFRVVGKPTAGVITIYPAIISTQGGSDHGREGISERHRHPGVGRG